MNIKTSIVMKIKTLVLATNNLDAVIDFYNRILDFRIVEQSDSLVSFQIGQSVLTFEMNTEIGENPTYHYALNIPTNQVEEAKQWLSERTALVEDEKGNDTIDFPNWNAHALYFYDSVGNIGELIARHDLDNQSDMPFSSDSIYSISEIGLPVTDVLDFKTKIQEYFNLPVYKAASAKFAPMGDPNGLFICVPLGRIWFPTTSLKSASFPVRVEIEGQSPVSLQYDEYTIFSAANSY